MNLDPEGISDLERKCVRQQCRTMYVCVLQSGHLGVLVEVGQDQNTSLPICATGIPSNLLNYRGHEGRGEERSKDFRNSRLWQEKIAALGP